jgi:copper(I)-binding protein
MRPKIKLILSALLLLTVVTSACGDEAQVSKLTVSAAWARPTPETSDVAAVYFSVASPVSDELVSVSTPVASDAMVHATEGDSSHSGGGHHGGGGSMTMHGSTLTVEPGKTATLSPGGMHIMLEGLRQPLKEGDVFDLELTFKNGGTVTTPVLVALNGL